MSYIDDRLKGKIIITRVRVLDDIAKHVEVLGVIDDYPLDELKLLCEPYGVKHCYGEEHMSFEKRGGDYYKIRDLRHFIEDTGIDASRVLFVGIDPCDNPSARRVGADYIYFKEVVDHFTD